MQATIAVDAVVFTVRNADVKILLIKRQNAPFEGVYALPGGIVKEDELFEKAVLNVLKDETGVSDIFLKQFGVFGKPGRDPRGRVVSIAFIAMISPDSILSVADWYSCKKLPQLAFDHAKIITDALAVLKREIQTTNIAYQMMPKYFTMMELKLCYEQILGRVLDKRNFIKRIRSLDILKETRQMRKYGAHRPSRLYAFRHSSYQQLSDKMHVFL